MLYVVAGLIVLASIGLAVYALISKSEAAAQLSALHEELQEQDGGNRSRPSATVSGMVVFLP